MNHLKCCGCQQCRAGKHKRGGFQVKRANRQHRRGAKLSLKQGLEPEKVISIGYTD